jgi:hypothetical protein
MKELYLETTGIVYSTPYTRLREMRRTLRPGTRS